jgi:hypothetical protein
LGERQLCKLEVTGSSPVGSIPLAAEKARGYFRGAVASETGGDFFADGRGEISDFSAVLAICKIFL